MKRSAALGGVLMAAGLALASSAEGQAVVHLTASGNPTSVVVVPSEPDGTETLAAQELVDHVERIAGVRLPVVRVPTADAGAFSAARRNEGILPVLLGGAAPSETRDRARAQGSREGAFLLSVTPERVAVAGTGEGTLFGVYELLEQLGVRWFFPGDLGTVIPRQQTVALTEQETAQVPSFAARHFQMGELEWQRRVRCGGPTFPSCHGLPGFRGGKEAKDAFAQHPEWFAEVAGQRRPQQVCVSNPEVVARVVAMTRDHFRRNPNETLLGMGPNDGGGFCECAGCRRLDAGDYDPFSGEMSVTDRYIGFFNELLQGISDEFPDRRIGFYIYHTYMRPPVKVRPDPRICGAFAPISLCRIHGPNNPVCPEKSYYRDLVEAWCRVLPKENLWERGYWSNLACPGFPFIIVHRLREQIPLFHAAGVYGWRVETFPHWGGQLPSHYVAARLMWDARADVDALLEDFAARFYGPAAEPMRRYTDVMNGALRDGDYHTGSSWDLPYLYPADVRQQVRGLLETARRQAARGEPIYARRVEMTAQTFAMLDAFIEMMEARAGGEFGRAKVALDRQDAAAATLLAATPPLIGVRLYESYMKRFFRPCTEQGAARLTGGNQVAAACADRWEFLLDPARIGEDIGYWRPELRGANWQSLRTASASWSTQGLRYTKGLAWYRQRVTIAREFAGRRLFLWCGGVDETAKVWVNGHVVGISHGAAFYPFELDVTSAVKAGAENVVVFCVANERVDELGTGGIVAPVMLYAPAAGAEARLENVRELKPTFP